MSFFNQRYGHFCVRAKYMSNLVKCHGRKIRCTGNRYSFRKVKIRSLDHHSLRPNVMPFYREHLHSKTQKVYVLSKNHECSPITAFIQLLNTKFMLAHSFQHATLEPILLFVCVIFPISLVERGVYMAHWQIQLIYTQYTQQTSFSLAPNHVVHL